MSSLKITFLMGCMFGFFILVGALIGGQSGMILAFVIAMAMNVGMYWYSDRIVLSMYKAQELSQSQAPGLHRMVQELSAAAGIPKPKIYLVPMPVPNAFATGRDPDHGVVAVTKGLLDILDEKEIEGVLAHELGHIKGRDTLISCLAAAMAGAIMMLATWARWAAIFGGFGRDSDSNIFELILMAVLAPVGAMMIQMAISRSAEFRADATAAKLTGNPRGLASALRKLETVSQRHPVRGGNMATSHLFIVNPFKAGAIANLFSTHPPTAERVKRLENMPA